MAKLILTTHPSVRSVLGLLVVASLAIFAAGCDAAVEADPAEGSATEAPQDAITDGAVAADAGNGELAQSDATAAPDEGAAPAPPDDGDATEDDGTDPYAVVNGTVDELLAQLNKLDELRNDVESLEDLIKTETAVSSVCQKILAQDPSDEQRDQAVLGQLKSHQVLLQYAATKEGLLAEAEAFSTEHLESDNGEIAEMALATNLVSRVHGFAESDADSQAMFIKEIAEMLELKSDDGLVNAVAMKIARTQQDNESAEVAMATATLFGNALIAGGNTARGEAMLGKARQLGLLGNPMEVFGTTMDGTEFDWSAYAGKVVLVDFWATWCGPCRAELPNVLENYEKYHDLGFEVVGVSLDDDRATLEAFLTEQTIPWTTLFSDDPDATGWQHPLATHYGIGSIPSVMLVGRDGNVVSLSARGPVLSATLERLLGMSDEPSEENDSAGE